MNRVPYFIVIVLVLVGGGAAYFIPLSASTPDQYRAAHRTQLTQVSQRNGDENVAAVEPGGPAARLDIPTPEHNFGTMDSLSRGHHTFRIKNTGDAPLELTDRGTSCKCAVGRLPQEPIAPGAAATIEVNWSTGSKSRYYSQTVTLGTNDPRRREVQLRVFGAILNKVVVQPSEINFERIKPGVAETAEAIVFSEAWPNFELDQLQTSMPGMSCSVESMDLPLTDEAPLRRGYRIKLTAPTNLASGPFTETVSFRVLPNQEDLPPQTCEVVVTGSVVGRLAVYGAYVNNAGEVDLGVLRPGQGKTLPLLVRIRDEDPTLTLESVAAEPDFLQVELQPEGESPGFYRLQLRVPEDAPECAYLGHDLGRLNLRFKHPRVKELSLRVRLGIIPPR